ncbi:MAG: GNAT family N-acetyltransferase [Bdellovibrionales bacterium]|nr:GNAT family N-acetyltransferase [Bdellovibrionales bacterium]
MMILTDERAEDFLSKALVHLEAQEGKNHLALGLALALADGRAECAGAFFGTVVKERTVHTVALQTPPNPLIITAGDQESIGLIAQELATRKAKLPGVVGPGDEAEFFAQEWKRHTGSGAALAQQQIIFEISRIRAERPKEGSFRMMHDNELPVAAEWLGRFAAEALPHEVHSPEQLREAAQKRIRSHELFVLEVGGAPVSMAGLAEPTRNGIRINAVYTPHENRRKGYSTACVGSLVSQQLAHGRKSCFLYADAASPASIALYLRLGFLEVDRPRHYLFDEPPRQSLMPGS